MNNVWREDIFDNLVRLKRGYDLPSHNIVDGVYPVVASSKIKAYHNNSKVKPPVVVTGRSGTLGKVQYINEPCWPLNTTLYSKSFRDNCPQYIYHFLKQMNLENYNAGAGVPTLNQNHLQKLKIKIPSLIVQEKISAILSSYDDLINVNNKRIQVLESISAEIYREWFVRFRFPKSDEFKSVKGIPSGWRRSTIKELGKITTGKTPSMSIPEYHNGEYPFYKTPDMHGKIFVFNTEDSLTEYGLNSQKSQIIEENSIMVACIGAKAGSVTAIATTKGCTNQQINSLSLYNKDWLYWAFFTLRNLKEQIELFGSSGATMTNLSKGKFSNLEIIIPPSELLEKYNNLVSPNFELLKNLNLTVQSLEQQKSILLPRLMSGNLSVDDLNIHYPPSMQTNNQATDN